MLFDEVNFFLQRVLALLVDTRAQYLPAASQVAADDGSKYTDRVIRKGEGGALRVDHVRKNDLPILAGFVHFPASTEMALDSPFQPSLPMAIIVEALKSYSKP